MCTRHRVEPRALLIGAVLLSDLSYLGPVHCTSGTRTCTRSTDGEMYAKASLTCQKAIAPPISHFSRHERRLGFSLVGDVLPPSPSASGVFRPAALRPGGIRFARVQSRCLPVVATVRWCHSSMPRDNVFVSCPPLVGTFRHWRRM